MTDTIRMQPQSPLDLLSARAQFQRDGETFVDWILRRVDYLLASEPDMERDRR